MYDKEKHQISTFKKLEPANEWNDYSFIRVVADSLSVYRLVIAALQTIDWLIQEKKADKWMKIIKWVAILHLVGCNVVIFTFPTINIIFFFSFLRLRQWSLKCAVGSSFFQFVHRPYPIVEVLMFPASGVGLEADGCWQRKGFGKQSVSNRWKGAYASKSPQPANSPVTNCGKILASSRLGMDRRSWWRMKRP